MQLLQLRLLSLNTRRATRQQIASPTFQFRFLILAPNGFLCFFCLPLGFLRGLPRCCCGLSAGSFHGLANQLDTFQRPIFIEHRFESDPGPFDSIGKVFYLDAEILEPCLKFFRSICHRCDTLLRLGQLF
ncbi:MAG: hypothetical protein IKH15_11970 [Bacteroidales bacterium]|nr:hypothetical protein [Bacteroidales bacterium]